MVPDLELCCVLIANHALLPGRKENYLSLGFPNSLLEIVIPPRKLLDLLKHSTKTGRQHNHEVIVAFAGGRLHRKHTQG